MIIFITTEYVYIKNDYDIEEINLNMDNHVGASECVLVLHTTNYHFRLPSNNLPQDDPNRSEFYVNQIRYIIQHESHLILNYSLAYMIKHFDLFQNSFKILFNLNPYLFIKNLAQAFKSINLKDIDFGFFENLICDNANADDVYKLLYLFLEEFRIDENNRNELIIEYTYSSNINFEEYSKRMTKNNIYCIVKDNDMEFIECEFDLNDVVSVNDLTLFMELDFNSNNEFTFDPNHNIYGNIGCIDYENVKEIDYNLDKFIENYDENDPEYTIEDILYLEIFSREMFITKLKQLKNGISELRTKKLLKLIDMLKDD